MRPAILPFGGSGAAGSSEALTPVESSRCARMPVQHQTTSSTPDGRTTLSGRTGLRLARVDAVVVAPVFLLHLVGGRVGAVAGFGQVLAVAQCIDANGLPLRRRGCGGRPTAAQ